MNITLRDGTPDDAPAVVEIFNYFVENSDAAYPAEKVGLDFFNQLYLPARELAFYVAEDNDRVIGFGCIRPFRESAVFAHCATITYFILPEYTGLGLGKRFLHKLEAAAKENGVTNMLAHISSKNNQSLNFHKKHGFVECGRFKNVGMKNGEYFDMVWMQKFI